MFLMSDTIIYVDDALSRFNVATRGASDDAATDERR